MKNQLNYLAEFRQILKTYKISETLKTQLNKTQLILLAAPTSVGRNTIIKELVRKGNYTYVISDTTRHPRMNDGFMEQNGREYWFKNEKEMLEGLGQNKYLEAAIIHNQQVSGINADEIKRVAHDHKIAIKDIEIQGVESYYQAKSDIIAIFVLPPSFEEWMRRLKHRGDMDDNEFRRRLKSAEDEFEYAITSNKFTFVVNDDLGKVVNEIHQLVIQAKSDFQNQNKCLDLVIQLNKSVQKYIR